MAAFSENSKKKLLTCSNSLQNVLTTAIKYFDFSIICGHRGKLEQDIAFKNKLSKLQWPESKHNTDPSTAVDIYPWHPKYKSLTTDPICIDRIVSMAGCTKEQAMSFIVQEYCMMAQTIRIAAALNKVEIIWGGDWDSDLDRFDQTFNDLCHFELV